MYYDYDENDLEQDSFENFPWKIRVNNQHIEYYEYKEDAIEGLLEEIDILSDNDLYENLQDVTDFDNTTEIVEYLSNLDYELFYEWFEDLFSKLNLTTDKINLINLNNDEPEFGEL